MNFIKFLKSSINTTVKKIKTKVTKSITPKEVTTSYRFFKNIKTKIIKSITPKELATSYKVFKKLKNFFQPKIKNEIETINKSNEVEQPKERKAVNVSFFFDVLNEKDGEKMANNLIKSLYNSLKTAELTNQDTALIKKALTDFQKLCDNIGYSNAGNYIFYLKETAEISEITFTNLYSSDSELVGEVIVNNAFINKLNDKQKINEFLNTLEMIKNWLG